MVRLLLQLVLCHSVADSDRYHSNCWYLGEGAGSTYETAVVIVLKAFQTVAPYRYMPEKMYLYFFSCSAVNWYGLLTCKLTELVVRG